MKTPFSLKPLLRFNKILIFSLTLFTVVIFSWGANLESMQSKDEHPDPFPFNLKINESLSLVLLGAGLLGFAEVLKNNFKKDRRIKFERRQNYFGIQIPDRRSGHERRTVTSLQY